jgi:hypothetical protein
MKTEFNSRPVVETEEKKTTKPSIVGRVVGAVVKKVVGSKEQRAQNLAKEWESLDGDPLNH